VPRTAALGSAAVAHPLLSSPPNQTGWPMEDDPAERRQRLIRETREQIKLAQQKIAEARARLQEIRIETVDRLRRVRDALDKGRRDDDRVSN
jgi:hypothetical protein